LIPRPTRHETGGVATTLPVPGKLWLLKSAFTDSRLKTIKEKIPKVLEVFFHAPRLSQI
jgi:hypothetical protein